MNEWLTPIVDAYVQKYGTVDIPNVWEVGSRDGIDGYEIAERIAQNPNKVQVTCIEPNPEQMAILKESYPQATTYQLAVSDKPAKKVPFTVYEGEIGMVGSSSLQHDWKDINTTPFHMIDVRVVRLDSLIKDEEIDVMKIDVEGYSPQALRGMGKKLRQVKVYHIESETESGTTAWIKEYMAENGYELFDEREQYDGMPDLVFRRVD